MKYNYLNDSEVALALAGAIKKWRIEPSGAGMTQEELARKSGVALSSLKRFEKTGNMTLGSFIAVLRGLGLLDRLESLVPSSDVPGPLELLERERAASSRERAPRSKKEE
jgi:transcriptional regulator with XRE-family HTH domain